VEEKLAAVKAEHLINARVGELSGGEIQRVLLAMALEPVPHVLLLDEPLSGVDVAGEKLVIKLLERLENEVKQLDYPLKQLNNKYDYKHNNYSSVRDYYSCKRNRIFPALVYSYKKLGAGKEIWFVIEVSSYGTAYLGFLVANYGEKTDKLLVSVRELEKHINLKYGTNKDECWFFWQYMPEGTADFYDIGKFPDFKAQNEPYRRLFDEEYFESYVGLCVTQIKAVLNGMTGGKEEQPYENS